MVMWLVEVEYTAGDKGWIHPAERPRVYEHVALPSSIRNAETAIHRDEVKSVCNNLNFRGRVKSIRPLKEVIA